jgi:hypothetical protein
LPFDVRQFLRFPPSTPSRIHPLRPSYFDSNPVTDRPPLWQLETETPFNPQASRTRQRTSSTSSPGWGTFCSPCRSGASEMNCRMLSKEKVKKLRNLAKDLGIECLGSTFKALGTHWRGTKLEKPVGQRNGEGGGSEMWGSKLSSFDSLRLTEIELPEATKLEDLVSVSICFSTTPPSPPLFSETKVIAKKRSLRFFSLQRCFTLCALFSDSHVTEWARSEVAGMCEIKRQKVNAELRRT